ncbi:Bug family tripartite tricarboxylate transporter substrate binding protein [Dankookia sp. GCM10030260]|uniref:Bug family tripartite tricarboxylate transporter substrate binding protein n=1 Tax=Dankookia sp. GCM10030260 TaxID=3273390 RepID=UPI0036225F4C
MSYAIGRRAALALGAGMLAAPAIAQAGFPSRPIRMYVPWGAGGTTDVQMRALCDAAGRRLGQPVIIENKSGAGGILGAQAMLTDKPDGYTLGQMPVSVFRTPLMSSRPLFDPLVDFTYVVHLCGYLFGVVVRADAPWKTFPEFLDYAKKNPGKINYGTPGIGTSLHLTMERIATERSLDWTHVPFRGFAENMNALLGGTIDVLADSSGWSQLVEDGRCRLLVTWGEQRAKRFPDAPTLREVGIDIVSASPYGIGGPKNLDPGAAKAIHEAFREALNDPAHLAVLDRFDMPLMYKGPEEYTAFVRQQIEEDRVMIQRLGLKLN